MSERFDALKAIASAISAFTDLDAVLTAALETTLEVLQVEGGLIQLVDPATDELVLAVQRGRSEAFVQERARLPWTECTVFPLKGDQQVLVVPDLRAAADQHQAYALACAEGYRSYAAIPLFAHREVVGTLSVMSHRAGWFQSDDTPFLATIGHLLGVAFRQAHLLQEAREGREQAEERRQTARLTALLETAAAINTQLHSQEVLQLLIAKAVEVLSADAGILWILDEGTQVLEVVASSRLSPASVGYRLKVGESATGRAVLWKRPVAIPDTEADTAHGVRLDYTRREGIRALLTVPLLTKDTALGAITVHSFSPRAFSDHEIHLLTLFAHHAAIALENARLYEATKHHAEALEQKVRERTRELEEANRHKSEFLANMSHELRTPLNSVIGFSELLQDQHFGPLNEKQARYVGNIHRSGQHLLALINDILDFSKVETGRLALSLQPLSLALLLEDALALVRPQAGRKSLTVTSTCQPDLPPVTADPTRLKQILDNLLSNAVKFTPAGGRITITARRVPVSQGMGAQEVGSWGAEEPSPQLPGPPAPQQFLEISVADTGIGINPEDLPRLFQTFVQLEHPLTKQYEGTGLGLALTKRLVELHGGQIWVTSPGQGHGSTFTFTLPIARGADACEPGGLPIGTGLPAGAPRPSFSVDKRPFGG